MGAFAVENMRTAFERGAAHVTLLCRQRGTVCPQLVDWVNFIRPWEMHDYLPRHAAAGDAEVLQAWRAAYDVSGAVRPECWQQDFFEIEPCILEYYTTYPYVQYAFSSALHLHTICITYSRTHVLISCIIHARPK